MHSIGECLKRAFLFSAVGLFLFHGTETLVSSRKDIRLDWSLQCGGSFSVELTVPAGRGRYQQCSDNTLNLAA